MNERNIFVWEPAFKGHYDFYLRLIVRGLIESGWTVTVATVASSPVKLPQNVVRVNTDPRGNPCVEPFEMARKLGINDVFIGYLDAVLLPGKKHRFIGVKDTSIRVHGILHYAIGDQQGCLFSQNTRSRKLLIQRLQNLFEKQILGNIFTLDERMSEQQINVGFPTFFFPDPWRSMPTEARSESRVKLGLPQDRIIFLHIGSDEKRKGLLDVLKLISKLHSPRPFIVRIGELKPKNTGKHTKLIQRLTDENRLFCKDGYISEETFDLYLRAADYVLLPYRSHAGSSGILSHAIGAGIPVVASDFGLIGKRVKELNLGLLYQNENMSDLRRAMLEAFQTPPSDFPVADAAGTFSPERFVGIIRSRFEI